MRCGGIDRSIRRNHSTTVLPIFRSFCARIASTIFSPDAQGLSGTNKIQMIEIFIYSVSLAYSSVKFSADREENPMPRNRSFPRLVILAALLCASFVGAQRPFIAQATTSTLTVNTAEDPFPPDGDCAA